MTVSVYWVHSGKDTRMNHTNNCVWFHMNQLHISTSINHMPKKPWFIFGSLEALQFLKVLKNLSVLSCLNSKECCYFYWISFDWKRKNNESLSKHSNVQRVSEQFFLSSKTISVDFYDTFYFQTDRKKWKILLFYRNNLMKFSRQLHYCLKTSLFLTVQNHYLS